MIFDILLFLYCLLLAPKVLFSKKKIPLLQKLSTSHLPKASDIIWIHAVSVGEVKAAQPLFRALKEKYPRTFFFITTTTTTGQAEAKRSLPEADAFRYLPFDFSWTTRRWARRLRPKLFLLIETDFWPNLLRAIQKSGGKTILVSGKLSARSARSFQRIAPLAKKLFSHIDLLCVQNEEHAKRFAPLLTDLSRLRITGNLKLDLQPQPIDLAPWRRKLSLSQPAVAITCTHPGEEEAILSQLLDLPLFFFLAPRHPHRFEEVATLLTRKNIPFLRWTQLEQRREGEKVLLVDAMGQLPICYSLSRLAIVGGSFTPKVGGHNILEPCLYNIPVFFGPSMHAQQELVQKVLDANAGRQVPLENLHTAVRDFFAHPSDYQPALRSLFASGRGATEKTLEILDAEVGGIGEISSARPD